MQFEFTTIEKELERNGRCYLPTVGISMAPLFYTHKKVVILERPAERAKKFDVILFHRPDGRYVLHRVVKVTPDGYFTRGDNYLKNDAFVPETQFVAVMTGYFKDQKMVTTKDFWYRMYVLFWGRPNPWRFVFQVCRAGLRKLFKKK